MVVKKEQCRDYALKIKQETGVFPTSDKWLVKNGYPCGTLFLSKVFGGYNNFRIYCGEKVVKRTENISIDWIKANCIIDSNNCWNWNNFLTEDGYGQLSSGGVLYKVHRLTYLLSKGIIKDELIVRHLCNNKKCCNPEHLELGTHSDNANDAVRNSRRIKNNNELGWILRRINSIEERVEFYLENIEVIEDCWISNILHPMSSGYYKINFNNETFLLHRLILSLNLNKNYKEIQLARHVCHNRKCINPNHILEGTYSDNAKDNKSHSKSYKLSIDEVKKIKIELSKINLNQKGSKSKFDKFWANKLNVSTTTIANIRYNKTWKDIQINE